MNMYSCYTDAVFIDMLKQETFQSPAQNFLALDTKNLSLDINHIKLLVKDFSATESSNDYQYLVNLANHLAIPFQNFLQAASHNPQRIMPSLYLAIEPCFRAYDILESIGKLTHGEVFFNFFNDPYLLIKSCLYSKGLIVHIDFLTQQIAMLKMHNQNEQGIICSFTQVLAEEPSTLNKIFSWRAFIYALINQNHSSTCFGHQTWNIEVKAS